MSNEILLKVLSGLQSGAEVVLEAGTYVVGSGPEDDLQLRDASLKAQHARLRISGEVAEIKADAGDILFATGVKLEAGDERWVQLEPLSVLVVGTTRLSVGPKAANWATITEDAEFRKEAQPDAVDRTPAGAPAMAAGGAIERLFSRPSLRFAMPAATAAARAWTTHPRVASACAAAAAVLLVVLPLMQLGGSDAVDMSRRDPKADRLAVERAVAALPFADKVRVQQEVDGQIFVKGIIKDGAERRAVLNALEVTRVPFRPRLATADYIMAEAKNLLGDNAARVRTVLRDDGVLALNGIVIDPKESAKLVDLFKNQLVGPTDIDATKLKNGKDLLVEIVRMARDEGIGANVIFALVGNSYVEATGAVLASQTAAWVATLVNYGDLFADKIPLRSLVRLAEANGTARAGEGPVQAVVVGGASDIDGRRLDLQRLRSGRSPAGEIFAGEMSAEERAAIPPAPKVGDRPQAADGRLPDGNAEFSGDGRRPLARNAPRGGPTVADPHRVIDRWASGAQPADRQERRIFEALDKLAGTQNAGAAPAPAGDDGKSLRRYLLAGGGGDRPFAVCTADQPADAPAMFRGLAWLELLSTIDGLSVTAMDRATQLLVSEIMLSPALLGDCLRRLPDQSLAARFRKSVFVEEVSANPDFVLYLARDVAQSPLRLTGADTGRNGYVVDATGRFLRAGSSIDLYSKVWAIGERGVVVETAKGVELVPFDRSIAWITRPDLDRGVDRPPGGR